MANLSDAFGTITVERVGNDLVEFLKKVQGGDAYYILVDDTENLHPDSDGDVEFAFGTCGRWAYYNNIEGYLLGLWMHSDEQKEAYDKFIKAFKEKDGLITIEYTDSDTAMDWMGQGVFHMSVGEDGEIETSENFDEESITLERFAEIQGETIYWAMAYIYGDEVVDKYDEYVEECKEKGKQPVEPDEWYDEIYEEV